MKTKSIIFRISIIIHLLFLPNIFPQEELNSFEWDGEPEIKDINQATVNWQSPEANSIESSISDFRVNEQDGNSQKYNIRSAINENGVSLIVWSDLRLGTQNIFAQLVNSEQELIGENFQVNSTEDVKSYTYPDVAVNSDNQFLVVWLDNRSGYNIYGQLIDEDGSFIEDNFEIDDENNNYYKLQTCIDTNGEEFIVAWVDSRSGSNYDIYAQRLNKEGMKIGENFIVNSDSQAVRKNRPDISLNKDGSFITTWYSNVDGGNKIYAVALSSTDSLLGTQFQVSDSDSVSSNNINPVTSVGKNGFIIVWQRYMNNDYNVVAQFIDSSSQKTETNFIVNDDLISTQYYPSAASDSVGNIIISWYDYRNGFAQIYAQEIEDDTLSGGNIKISEDEMIGTKREISCSINDHGNKIISWLDLMEPTEYRIYSRSLDSNSSPISPSTRVDNDSYSSNEEKPSIEVFDDGSSIIAWTDQRNRNYGSYFQRFDSEGIPIGNNIQVNNGSTQYDTKVSKLGNQNFILTWREYFRGTNNQNEIIAQKYFKTGEKLGEKIIVSSNETIGNSSSQDASSNSNGEFAVVFNKQINGVYRIYAQKFDNNGVALGNNILVTKDTTSSYYLPKVALDSLGNFAVTYYGYNDSNNFDIFLNRYNSMGIEIDSALIVNDEITNNTQYYPDISINNSGECIITWYDYKAGNGVNFQKYKNIWSIELFEKVDSNVAVADYNFAICRPTVSLNENGEFAISWYEQNNSFTYSDLKFRIFNSDITPLTDIMYVTESQERNQINQDLHFTNDKIFNVWQDNQEKGVGYDIWANVFDYKDFITSIDENSLELPNEFVLNQNYPNPFNPTTTIKYAIPNVVKASNARSLQTAQLHIYDILGRKVKTLLNKQQSPGNYEVIFDASELSSGIYFYTLNVGEFVQTKKMMLLK